MTDVPIKRNVELEAFVKGGTKLLEESERPNVITFAQFEPFIPLYKIDKEKYENDTEYRLNMNRLMKTFTQTLSINWYQPIIVIYSEQVRKPVYFLERRFTRIKADNMTGSTMRDTVPSAVPVASGTTVPELIMRASALDIVAANQTPEQMEYFRTVKSNARKQLKNFVEQNLSPEKREQLIGSAKQDAPEEGDIEDNIILDDDD